MKLETIFGTIIGFLTGMVIIAALILVLLGPQVTDLVSYMACEELEKYILSYPSDFFMDNIAPVSKLKCGI